MSQQSIDGTAAHPIDLDGDDIEMVDAQGPELMDISNDDTQVPSSNAAEASEVSERGSQLEDLKLAVYGGRRGRPKGSGLGEKRKASDQYSTNANTVKSRKRYETMGPLQRAVHAASTADSSAISRNQKKLKKTTQFQAMNETERQQALEEIKERTLNARFERGYNANLVKSEMQMMLEEQELADEDFVENEQLHGNFDDTTSGFWCDIDEYMPTEVRNAGKKGQEVEEFIADEPDLLASIMDLLYEDRTIESSKRTLTIKEQKDAFENMKNRQRNALVEKGNQIAFTFFKEEFLGRIEQLSREEKIVNGLTPSLARKTWPHKYFSKESRGLLRCVWAMHEGVEDDPEWIELPGPAELWPDDQKYYVDHGFEIRPSRKDHHRKALQLLAKNDPPSDWMKHVVHESDRYELVWNSALR